MPKYLRGLGGYRLSYVDKIEILSKRLRPMSEEQDADAAVALLLKPADRSLKALFVKRVKNPSDPWSGQMALPGGRGSAEDRNLEETVIRETLEETNINLLDRCRFLGAMNALRSTERPEMKILPFVVVLEHEPAIKLNAELEEFVWILLEDLIKHKGTAERSFGKVPAYAIGKHVIWGLTYRILEKLFCTFNRS